jgi:hypothetical protein
MAAPGQVPIWSLSDDFLTELSLFEEIFSFHSLTFAWKYE